MDPNFIARSDWYNIGDFLFGLLFVPGLTIIAAMLMLMAHAIIPSLVTSGHAPQQLLKLRVPLYGLASVTSIAIIVVIVFVASQARSSFGEVYSRWWL